MSVGYNPRTISDGLVLCLDAANPKSYNYNIATYSQDFQNAVYTNSTGLVSAIGLLAPDGTLTATTLTDDVSGVYESFSRTFSITNDSLFYNISIYIKKTTGGTSTRTGFNVSLTGGTTKNYNIRFNADTGVATGGDTNSVTSEDNNYWRLTFTVSNNSTGNTSLNIAFYPATGFYNGADDSTATGSHTVWGFQVTKGSTLLPYRVNINDSATTWYDLSKKAGTDFTINAGAYNGSGPKYMDFGGSFGCAVTTSGADTTFSGDITVVLWTRILNSSANWRTLFRAETSGNDHHVIVQSGAWAIGMYDNVNGTGFNSTGFSQQDLPGYSSNAWNMLVWRWANIQGQFNYYTLTYNDTPEVVRGTMTSINTRFKTGFRTLGAYNASSPSQFWGDIAHFSMYNRRLTDDEVRQMFQSQRGRFGI